MLDNGVQPDSSAGDSVYSGHVTITMTRDQTGAYTVRFSATASVSSNVLLHTFHALRDNSAPLLDTTSLEAPDTVALPTSGFVAFAISIVAIDSDGIGDIRQVFLRNLDSPTNPDARIQLRDDGNTGPDPRSGDLIAGDGRFTVTVRLDATNARGVFRFGYQASDAPGDTSATFVRRITVI
jgi:hypothetical protein